MSDREHHVCVPCARTTLGLDTRGMFVNDGHTCAICDGYGQPCLRLKVPERLLYKKPEPVPPSARAVAFAEFNDTPPPDREALSTIAGMDARHISIVERIRRQAFYAGWEAGKQDAENRLRDE